MGTWAYGPRTAAGGAPLPDTLLTGRPEPNSGWVTGWSGVLYTDFETLGAPRLDGGARAGRGRGLGPWTGSEAADLT